LPTNGPAPLLQAVAAVFEGCAELGITADARLQALCALDEHARSSCSALAARLLDSSPKQVLCDSAWSGLYDYHRALAGGYGVALDAPGPADGDPQTHARKTLAACRALYALAKCNMLLRMRYREPAAPTWVTIERLLGALPGRSADSARLALYPDEPGETTLEREYLLAAAFETVPSANLLPAQIHAAELLLRRHAAELRLGDRFDAALMPFAVDPSGDARPRRWIDGLAPRPGLRFFGVGAAHAHVLAERDRAERTRGTPEWLAPTQLSAERYRELLDVLAAHWAPKPPARRERRDAGAGEILVAHDFALIRRLIGFVDLAHAGRSLEYDRFSAYSINGMVRGHNDMQMRAPTEPVPVSQAEALRNLESFERALDRETTAIWRVVDTSESGIGAESMGASALKPGMLIAYRAPDSAQWSLALVRRLNRAANGSLRVGLRKLAGVPKCARLAVNDPRQSASKAAGAPTLHYDAIQLAGEESSLLLPPGVFDATWRYTLTVGHRWDFIRMQRCTECGLDFEQVAYVVVHARQAA
jgi:hypothetical protein